MAVDAIEKELRELNFECMPYKNTKFKVIK
jgi:hypothetical protein